MAAAITLSNGRIWRTKAAALSHFKAMLARYAGGNVAEDRNDHDDLVALVEPYCEAITDGSSKTDTSTVVSGLLWTGAPRGQHAGNGGPFSNVPLDICQLKY